MPQLSPQHRFLLRGSALLIALLVLWWFVLSGPMTAGLRVTVETTGGLFFGGRAADLVHETATGDWAFHVPIQAIIPATSGQPASQIHSVDFDLARKDIGAFTFSLPVFWALMLAAPDLRRHLRTLALGTVIMAGIELVLLMVLIEINARNNVGQVTHAQSAGDKWLLHFGEYMVVGVVPYAAPFVLAVCLHRGLRQQILGWIGEPDEAPAAPAPQPKRKSRSSAK